MEQMLNDIVIAGLSFSDTAIEISYFNKSNQANGVQVMEIMTVDITPELNEYAEEILSGARDLVDEALLIKRNPKQSFKGPR